MTSKVVHLKLHFCIELKGSNKNQYKITFIHNLNCVHLTPLDEVPIPHQVIS